MLQIVKKKTGFTSGIFLVLPHFSGLKRKTRLNLMVVNVSQQRINYLPGFSNVVTIIHTL